MSDPDAHDIPTTGSTSRRSAIALLAGASAAALAACSSSDSSAPAASSAPAQPASSPAGPTDSIAPSVSESAAPAASESAAGTVIGSASDVPVGGGKIFSDAKIVVLQPKAGDFVAFSAVCTHQSCLVASVESNEILCACHGARYSAADGSVISGPAPAGLAPQSVRVDGTNLVV